MSDSSPDAPAHLPANDEGLAQAGLGAAASDPAGGERVLLIACGALAREILAVTRSAGWSHLDLICLPAKLHLTPERIPGEVTRLVTENRAAYARIFVVYADCGTGGLLDAACEALGVTRIAGPHCYSFFDGNEAFAQSAEDEMRSFYLTDFLVRQFDAFVWKPMGLDRHPQLRDMIFGNYERLIYLAQTDDPALDRQAEAAAKRLGLDYLRRKTGYGDLTGFLSDAARNAKPEGLRD